MRRWWASVRFGDRGEDAIIQLRTTGDAELELWAVDALMRAPFERFIGKPLRFEASGARLW